MQSLKKLVAGLSLWRGFFFTSLSV